MLVVYVLCGIVAGGLLYLAWMYYMLFCKEKQKDKAESFYSRNQEFAFAYPSRESSAGKSSVLPTAGKIAAVAGLIAASRKHRGDKEDSSQSDFNNEIRHSEDHADVLLEGIDAVAMLDSEKETNIDVHSAKDRIQEMDDNGSPQANKEKSVHFVTANESEFSVRSSGSEYRSSNSNEGNSTTDLTSERVTSGSYGFGQEARGSSDDFGYGNAGNDQSYGAYDNNYGGDY